MPHSTKQTCPPLPPLSTQLGPEPRSSQTSRSVNAAPSVKQPPGNVNTPFHLQRMNVHDSGVFQRLETWGSGMHHSISTMPSIIGFKSSVNHDRSAAGSQAMRTGSHGSPYRQGVSYSSATTAVTLRKNTLGSNPGVVVRPASSLGSKRAGRKRRRGRDTGCYFIFFFFLFLFSSAAGCTVFLGG